MTARPLLEKVQLLTGSRRPANPRAEPLQAAAVVNTSYGSAQAAVGAAG
jgi:hypothetical protein